MEKVKVQGTHGVYFDQTSFGVFVQEMCCVFFFWGGVRN